GLVLQGEQPKEGILLVEDYSTNLEQMANLMNQMAPPNFQINPGAKPRQSDPYNFIIRKHSDIGL
ncbi:MAG: ATP-binding protein, partial [Methanobacteriota archaeon]